MFCLYVIYFQPKGKDSPKYVKHDYRTEDSTSVSVLTCKVILEFGMIYLLNFKKRSEKHTV